MAMKKTAIVPVKKPKKRTMKATEYVIKRTHEDVYHTEASPMPDGTKKPTTLEALSTYMVNAYRIINQDMRGMTTEIESLRNEIYHLNQRTKVKP